MIKVKIGIDAGNIWQILNKKGSVKIIDLKKITKLDIKDIYISCFGLACKRIQNTILRNGKRIGCMYKQLMNFGFM